MPALPATARLTLSRPAPVAIRPVMPGCLACQAAASQHVAGRSASGRDPGLRSSPAGPRAARHPDPGRSRPPVLDPALYTGAGLAPVPEPVPDDPLWTAKQDSVSLPRHLGLPGQCRCLSSANFRELAAVGA